MNNKNRQIISAAQHQQGIKHYTPPSNVQPHGYKGDGQPYNSQTPRNFTVNNAPSVDYFTVNVLSTQLAAANIVLFDSLRQLNIFNNNQFIPVLPLQVITIDPLTGNMVFTTAGTTIVFSCNEIPYYSLLLSIIVKPFRCSGIRFSSLTQAQQQNKTIIYRNRDFLGSQAQSLLTFKASISPNQFQALILDCVIDEMINAESAIVTTINTIENLSFQFAVSEYNTANVNSNG